MARGLRVVDGRVNDFVRAPRTALVEPAIDVQALASELDEKLATIYALVWSNKRTRALNEIAGLQLSAVGLRSVLRDFAGYVEELPSDTQSQPARVA